MSEGEIFKHAGYVPMTRETLDDFVSFQDSLKRAVHRRICPWEYPDPSPFPRIILFPWLERAVETFGWATHHPLIGATWSVIRSRIVMHDRA